MGHGSDGVVDCDVCATDDGDGDIDGDGRSTRFSWHRIRRHSDEVCSRAGMAGAAAAGVGASEAEALDLRAWGAVRRPTRPDGLLQVGEGSPLLDVLEGLGCGHGVIDAAELVVAERGDCFQTRRGPPDAGRSLAGRGFLHDNTEKPSGPIHWDVDDLAGADEAMHALLVVAPRSNLRGGDLPEGWHDLPLGVVDGGGREEQHPQLAGEHRDKASETHQWQLVRPAEVLRGPHDEQPRVSERRRAVGGDVVRQRERNSEVAPPARVPRRRRLAVEGNVIDLSSEPFCFVVSQTRKMTE